MTEYDIKCNVIENRGCPIAKGEYVLGGVTPAGMCIKAYGAAITFATAMRFAEKTPWENDSREAIVTCPDGFVKYKLERMEKA